ncbi:hypothetical protein SAMN06265218_109158 [Fodinibius sediminis]|uniref:Phospholipase_D-nuclease N-terminal n=1 Tax=Fodinibius sediminis TaxID=1214077 RepID=A0A521DBT5_9BACT|nr:hypothetical protein SAMN06265218_109158 [Fodinibius sediminis]
MLQTFYNSFGFIGSISISFLIFLLFIFWLAGVAGISQLKDGKAKNVKLFFSIFFPPYPIVWLFWDMQTQSRLMKEESVD